MGQRLARRDYEANSHESTILDIFSTDLGWFGLSGRNQQVTGLTIGHSSANDVRQAIHASSLNLHESSIDDESDWNPELRKRLQRFTQGEVDEFKDVDLTIPVMTDFQHQVATAVRNIPYGETVSYAELAERAGSPRAARAVGNVMASNRIPIIIPCHRVVAAGGKWGGFSAPQGVDLKKQILIMESIAIGELASLNG
jgi:methylated-DNA-[protein]-cysteine S-methyltransferase